MSKTRSAVGGLLALAIFLVMGCADAHRPGNSTAYQDGSDSCSESFMNDFFAVSFSLADSQTSGSSTEQALNAIDAFSTRYKDVVCQADLHGLQTTVDVNSVVARWKSLVNQRGSGGN